MDIYFFNYIYNLDKVIMLLYEREKQRISIKIIFHFRIDELSLVKSSMEDIYVKFWNVINENDIDEKFEKIYLLRNPHDNNN